MKLQLATRQIIRSTARLQLVTFERTDAPFIVELLNDPDCIRFIGDRGVRSEEDAQAYLRDGPLASYESFGFGLWLVVLDGERAGMCGILKRDTLGHPDLGFAFLPAYRRAGYAREAARATLDWAKERTMGRLDAVVSPTNARSIALLEELGFVAAGEVALSPSSAPILRYSYQPG